MLFLDICHHSIVQKEIRLIFENDFMIKFLEYIEQTHYWNDKFSFYMILIEN